MFGHGIWVPRSKCTIVCSVPSRLDLPQSNQASTFPLDDSRCQCHLMPHINHTVLHFARTGLVTAPCSTISHLRPDDTIRLSIPQTLASIKCATASGSYIWSKLPAVHSSIFAPSFSHKKLVRIFTVFHQASRECIRFFYFSPSKQVRSCCHRQRDCNEGSELAFLLRVKVSHFTFRVMRRSSRSGSREGINGNET